MPERPRRLHLALVDRVDPGADDLAHVRALVEPEGEDAGDDRAVEREEPEVERASGSASKPRSRFDAEVDEEDLDEQRRAAEDPARRRPRAAQRQEPRHPHQARRSARAPRPGPAPAPRCRPCVQSARRRRGPGGRSAPRRCASRRAATSVSSPLLIFSDGRRHLPLGDDPLHRPVGVHRVDRLLRRRPQFRVALADGDADRDRVDRDAAERERASGSCSM